MNKQLIATTLFCITTFTTIAAKETQPDFMRSIGKIYVVVAVLVAIFIGIVFFLIYLERKVSRLENLSNFNKDE